MDMTVVGKILVFLNLLLSVVTAGMIVLIYTTRTNWKMETEKYRNLALVAEANYKSVSVSRDSDTNSLKSQYKPIEDENKLLRSQNDALTVSNDELKNQNVKQSEELTRAVTTHKNLDQEVSALKIERDKLTKTAQSLRDQVVEIQKDLNDQKLLAVTNKIEADTQTAKARRMLDRVEELEKNITVLTSKINSLGGSTGSSSTSLLSPPPTPAPRDVRGTVRAVSTNGLLVINIGSDSGITAGNKLQIMHVDLQNPKNSVYLGELVISRTEPKQAVGQFYPKQSARPDERLPKVGDTVSTSLGSP